MARTPRRAAVNSSASHVFDVLRFVAQSEEPMGVTEISRRLKLPASTVHRALVTLEEASYIQRYQNFPAFELGLMPHLLNRALLNQFTLHSYSRPILHGLAAETGHTVSLWYRLGWYAVRIGGAFGTQDVYHRARLGDTELLQSGPGPAAILAYLTTDERKSYEAFVRKHFPETPPVPGGWNELEQRLTTLRGRGFSSQALAIADAFHAIALPIRNEEGRVIGSLMTEGGTADTIEPSDKMRETCTLIEEGLRADPERFRSPFAHVPPDEIVIRTVPPADGPDLHATS